MHYSERCTPKLCTQQPLKKCLTNSLCCVPSICRKKMRVPCLINIVYISAVLKPNVLSVPKVRKIFCYFECTLVMSKQNILLAILLLMWISQYVHPSHFTSKNCSIVLFEPSTLLVLFVQMKICIIWT